MPRVDLTVHVDIERTPRVTQLEGMFDVPRTERAVANYHFDVPIEEHDWQIGLITGPSGAGKSTVARHIFGDALVDEAPKAASNRWHSHMPSIAALRTFNGSVPHVTTRLEQCGYGTR